MKYWTYIILLIIISCNNQQQQVGSPGTTSAVPSISVTNKKNEVKNEICWIGNLNGKTPIFIHYQVDSNIIVGEIIYLNTKNKQPIKLLGTIEENKSYRLLEFENTGNITGIITGEPVGNIFNGSWFSPKTRNELVLNLVKKDTVINPVIIESRSMEIFGDYHYQYSKAGYQGDFNLKKLNGDNVSFNIFSVTGEPGRNIANIETDTITLTSKEFIYKVPDTDSCEFKVKFYKDFAFISYTKGYCMGQFGTNATIDGIFLKSK